MPGIAATMVKDTLWGPDCSTTEECAAKFSHSRRRWCEIDAYQDGF